MLVMEHVPFRILPRKCYIKKKFLNLLRRALSNQHLYFSPPSARHLHRQRPPGGAQAHPAAGGLLLPLWGLHQELRDQGEAAGRAEAGHGGAGGGGVLRAGGGLLGGAARAAGDGDGAGQPHRVQHGAQQEVQTSDSLTQPISLACIQ